MPTIDIPFVRLVWRRFLLLNFGSLQLRNFLTTEWFGPTIGLSLLNHSIYQSSDLNFYDKSISVGCWFDLRPIFLEMILWPLWVSNFGCLYW